LLLRTIASHLSGNFSRNQLQVFKTVYTTAIVATTQCNACLQGRPQQVRGPMQDLGAGPIARPKRGAPLSSDFMTSSCSVNRVTIVVERRYTAKH